MTDGGVSVVYHTSIAAPPVSVVELLALVELGSAAPFFSHKRPFVEHVRDDFFVAHCRVGTVYSVLDAVVKVGAGGNLRTFWKVSQTFMRIMYREKQTIWRVYESGQKKIFRATNYNTL